MSIVTRLECKNVYWGPHQCRNSRIARAVLQFIIVLIGDLQVSLIARCNNKARVDCVRSHFILSKVGIYLGRKDSASLKGVRVNHHHSNFQYLHGPVSRSSTSPPMDRLGVRRTLSSWPVRNGSPSPWLQGYKIKKRAATSYALQKPTEDGAENGTKRTPKYVNLSNAVILDAF